ncbi:MAG TPA: type I phosphomannose isomerase catalytic subunit [Planctomycetota bacterium]|nr:type I phosphomannose isomerase catalytic subunit [Planctomycetota bacterium]
MSTFDLTQPLYFKPVMMERVWGANRLDRLFGKPIPPGQTIGESWELVDRPEAQSTVTAGPCEGRTLRELMEHDPQGVLGALLSAARPDRFPLLVKYVDAGTPLSVQVHPDDHGAIPFKDRGKSECWVVVHLEPGALITRGLKPGTTRAQYEKAVREDRVEDVLHSFVPKLGDLIALPPGMVHAIGSGVVVAEIQQNSDLTFRIYDYKRVGLDGKPRKLHIQEALASIRFGDPGNEFAGDMRADTVRGYSGETVGGVTHERLLEGVYFALSRYRLEPGATLTLPRDLGAPRIVMAIEGQGSFNGRELKAGDTTLLCAAAEDASIAASRSGTTVLVSRPTLKACERPS